MKTLTQKSTVIYLILIALYVILQVFFLTRLPDIMEDEPWYANTAYNFSQGNWFTNTNAGHQGGDFFIVYTFILGIGIKLFGCTLYVTRMVSVVAGIFALWGLISILKAIRVSKLIVVITLLMFIFSNVTYIVFRTTRPEGWILALGIWSLFYLIKFHQTNDTKAIIWVAIFASLSFLTHPNGVLFPAIAGVYLIIYSIRKKNISNLIYFGLIAACMVVIHFVIVFSNPNISFRNFIIDLKDRNSITNTEGSFFGNIVETCKMYTLGIKRLYILLFEIGILIVGILFSKKQDLLRYISLFGILTLVLSLSMFNPYSSRHFGEILVYSFLSYALVYESFKNEKLRALALVLGGIYLLNNLAGDVYLIYGKHKNTPYSTIEKNLSAIVPDKSIVLTTQHFWYPLKNTDFYGEYTSFDFKKAFGSLDGLIQSNEVDYVILTQSMVSGKTGTSGRAEKVPEKVMTFFQKISYYATQEGLLVAQIPTIGYDTISVYKMK
jgi:hypothetical protein